MGIKSHEILYVYATQGRPTHVKNVIDRIFSKSKSQNFSVILGANKKDNSINNNIFISSLSQYIKRKKLFIYLDDFKSKVEAINKCIQSQDDEKWDIAVHISDFVNIQIEGFDKIIRNAYTNTDKSVLFPAINDNGYENSHLLTCGRKLYDKQNNLFDNRLKSEYYFEEYCNRINKTNNRLHYAKEKLYYYRHPKWLFETSDGHLINNINCWKQDLEIYEST